MPPQQQPTAQKKPTAQSKRSASSPSRRRTPQAPHAPVSLSTAESRPNIYQSPPTILPVPGPQEDPQGSPTTPPTTSEAKGATDIPQEHLGTPHVSLSPHVAEELTALWPDLQALLAWWQERQRLAQQEDTPDRKLVRQTYHIEQRYIDAVRRESDLTGESYAAVVNRAFARYFAGR